MNKSKTKNIVIFFVLLNLVFGVGYGYLFNYIRSVNQSISEMVHDIDSQEAKSETLASLGVLLVEVQPYVESLDTYFVGSKQVVGFIEYLETLAEKNNVIVEMTVAVHGTDIENDFKEILGLEISTTGTWENTFKYLNILENLPYKVNIERVGLSLEKGEIEGDVWKGSYDFTVLKIK